ncbi:hypothetical protein TM_0044 [Thermotoga maritima MSB8]|uniref:Uncharacterized protein n=1 Tax=Thermotoga maritima (strain ATCC 43589 / DSM 3109 / JCM 10099 / NBRC 100826 / MSB8) TaxID=243274 RepID=Q9WXQ1_THEMA|nr:hypothetical protein TM_0044 [Thermotoga maritima MSB8]
MPPSFLWISSEVDLKVSSNGDCDHVVFLVDSHFNTCTESNYESFKVSCVAGTNTKDPTEFTKIELGHRPAGSTESPYDNSGFSVEFNGVFENSKQIECVLTRSSINREKRSSISTKKISKTKPKTQLHIFCYRICEIETKIQVISGRSIGSCRCRRNNKIIIPKNADLQILQRESESSHCHYREKNHKKLFHENSLPVMKFSVFNYNTQKW